jgi:hypothetical protein
MSQYKPVTRGQAEYVPISDTRIAELTKKAVDVGARIHILRRVHVEQIRKVGNQYTPDKGMIEEDFILLNFPMGDNWNKALRWAELKGLKRTHPRNVFTIGKHHPTLHTQLGQNPMYVVATEGYSLRGLQYAYCVWWYDSECEVRISRVGVSSYTDEWFAFRE